MQNLNQLSKQQLVELLEKQSLAMVATERGIAQRDDVIRQLEGKLQQLERDYIKLWQERFAAKSERYIENPDQLRIDFGDTDEAADAAEGLAEAVEEVEIPGHKRGKCRKNRVESLPAHLPRKEIVVDVPDSLKCCECHGERVLLPESMWDVVERLGMKPAEYYVERLVYRKYGCKSHAECGIVSAERPTGIVEGDKYDASIAAEIITNKYAFYLPVYRQQDLFAGCGWTPSRSTLLNILTRCHFILSPLLDHFRRTLQADSHVACDDTSTTLLYSRESMKFDLDDPKQKRIAEVIQEAVTAGRSSINAKMWAYRGVNVKLNVFDFTVSRHRDGPEQFFRGYRGTILGDCWHGFGAIAGASEGAILRAACGSHARRKFEEATDYPEDRRKWLQWFQQLFDIEARAQKLSEDDCLKLREAEAKPIWDAMRAEMDAIDARTEQVVLPKSELRKALNYVRNHWTELTRYLSDARLPIDNNECEQLMKQAALGRKNWLFAGSVAGGERIAGFLTLASSAHRNDIDVRSYIHDILKRLLAGETDYEQMLPWSWAAANPGAVRQYRQEERRDRNDRKQSLRDQRRARERLIQRRSRKP